VLTDGRLYFTAALAGALLYLLLLQLPVAAVVVLWVPIVIIIALRFLSLRYDVGIPKFVIASDADPDAG
jgi:uncharacterized membrane protein YeiH